MDLRKQIRIAIGGALAAQEGSDGAADAVMEVLAKQEPYAFAVNFPESSRVELVHDLDEAYEDMTYEAYEVRKLYLAPGAQPAPSVPTALLVAVANLVAQMEIVSRVGLLDTPSDKDSCAAFCVAEGTWLELMSAVESLASSALAAAPEAKP